MNHVKSYSLHDETLDAVEQAAARYGLTRSEAVRRIVHFGTPMLNAEQVAILKSGIGRMETLDDVQDVKRMITTKIKTRSDEDLHEVMMED